MSSLSTVSRALATSGLVPIEARILLAHVVERDRAWLAAHGDAELTVEQAKTFDALARRRHNGEPVAYLTGRREFYGLDLEITPEVLIPRSETELLVELALMRMGKADAARVLDLGSGSGAVALAIASQRPAARVLGADVSPAAVALARRNAERLQIPNAEFIESDWFDSVPRADFELIVANPPYVAEKDPHLIEGDLRFEPAGALRGGVDGLRAIRAIVGKAGGYLASSGWLLFEHGFNQAETVQALLRDAGFADVQSRRDLAGIPRVTFGRRAPPAE
jgi:release factor glutamine methyltransferase